MSLNEVDAERVTITPSVLHAHAAYQYFAVAAPGMFLRLKIGREKYLWSKIVSVARVEEEMYSWLNKNFDVVFMVDRLEHPVRLTWLSSKPPTAQDVQEYVAQFPDEVLSSHAAARDATKIRFDAEVLHRVLSDQDKRDIVVANTRLKGMVGNPTVRATVTTKRNLELVVAAVRDEERAGPLSAGPQRTSSNLNDSLTSNESSSSPLMQRSSSQLANLLKAEDVQRWEESEQDEQLFYKYVSNNDRCSTEEVLVELTQRNRQRNSQQRLRGLQLSEKMDRKSFLVEGKGMWITDDDDRERAAVRLAEIRREEEEKKEKQQQEGEKQKKEPAKAKTQEEDDNEILQVGLSQTLSEAPVDIPSDTVALALARCSDVVELSRRSSSLRLRAMHHTPLSVKRQRED